MDHNEKDILLIDQFLRGELSPAEESRFKQRIIIDSAFEESYLQARAMQINLRKMALDEKRAMLRKIETKLKSSASNDNPSTIVNPEGNQANTIKRRRLLFILSAAAAIALVISIFNPWSGPSNPYADLFDQNFEGYLSHVIKRGTTHDIDKLKSRAYALYEIQEYEKSAPLLEQIAKSGDISSYLYAAIAYTGMHEYEKSQTLLRKYKNNTESLRDAANLYTAINHLMLGEKQDAQTIFKDLSSRTGFIGDKAKSFLNGIQK